MRKLTHFVMSICLSALCCASVLAGPDSSIGSPSRNAKSKLSPSNTAPDIGPTERAEMLKFIDQTLTGSFYSDQDVVVCRDNAGDGDNDALAALYSIANGKQIMDKWTQNNLKMIAEGYSMHQVFMSRRKNVASSDLDKIGQALIDFQSANEFCRAAAKSKKEEQDK